MELTPVNPNASPSLIDVIAASLCRLAAMPEQTADSLARSIATTAAELGYGGTDYYLPGLTHLTRYERDARIRAEWNGKNVSHLCRKHGISRTTLYRIVSRPRED